jgi:di/tricarboxylate transporter
MLGGFSESTVWLIVGAFVFSIGYRKSGLGRVSLPLLGSDFINATMVVFVVISLMLVTGVIVFDDIVSEKSAWEVFFYFTSLLTLSSGLNEIGFIKWVAEGYAKTKKMKAKPSTPCATIAYAT